MADQTDAAGPPRVDPAGKYLRDLIAGRPVFAHPSEAGGFRLRYGRARNHGFATGGVHPATMHVVDDFLATGTQLKTERPGKAAGVVPVDSIEGPTVKLANGDVRRIDDPDQALDVRNGIVEILDLGEYLINYGEFVENNHQLAPASYTVEWWVKEFAAAGADVQALRDAPDIDVEHPTPELALKWAADYDAPLHPAHTYLWHDIDIEAFEALAEAAACGTLADGTLRIANEAPSRQALETLLVPHSQGEELVVPDALPLVRSLGLAPDLTRTWDDLPEAARNWPNAMRAVQTVAPFDVRERAPTRIGARMGRPEKSEVRELSPAVHTLFPLGEAGGDQRDVAAAANHTASMADSPGMVEVSVGRRRCEDCGEETYAPACPSCDGHTEPTLACPSCDIEVTSAVSGRAECPRCGRDATSVHRRTIDLKSIYRDALEAVGERENTFEMLKGVKGLMSAHKTPEPVEKGVLRAKHGISAFKDGTIRYDMTDLPVTAVTPAELDVSVEDLRRLGYETDIDGEPLEYADQLVSLRTQDVVLSNGAADHLIRVADFVDNLLESFYGLDPFYEVEDRDDLVGELVFGMAPHTSAAVVGRVVGFTSAAVGYAHPYFHAAKRRNCFHPDTKVWYEDETGAWHYERIETLVEERLEDPREDDFGTLIQELHGEVRVPSIDGDGQTVTKPVKAVSRHPSQEHLVKIETQTRKAITVTPDHPVIRWDGGIERIDAMEIDEGDQIPTPNFPEQGPRFNSESLLAVDGGPPRLEVVKRTRIVPTDVEFTYSLTVRDTHAFVANGLHAANCDGDEDCVMLLMDGLLNFSKSYLPDTRGGSVTEDSRLVAVNPDGEVQFLTFDEFWDVLSSPIKHDGKFQKRTCISEGWWTYAFDDDHGASLQPIEKAIRYPAADDETLVRVETEFGRALELTEHHSLFRYENDIQEVAGGKLSEGDLIVAPRTLGIDPETTTIDVTDCLDDPYVVIDDDVETYLTAAWESAERGDEVRQAFQNGLSYRLRRRKMSYERFRALLDRSKVTGVPSDIRIGLPGSSDGIRRTIEVDEEFGWLLGLFVAEGTLSSTYPALNNADETLIEKAADITESTIGHEPGVRWSNRAYEMRFPSVFRDVLFELGFKRRDTYNSSEKVVPGCILKAPREVVISFLRGFIAGDGSETSDDNVTTVAFHTVSEDVKDGLIFLLHRLGVVSNVSYRDDRPGSRQPIYTVTVSGGAGDNPLRRVLDGDEPHLPKSLVIRIPDVLMELREMDIEGVKQPIPKHLKRRENVSLEKLREMLDELEACELPDEARNRLDDLRPLVEGDLSYLRVKNIERVDYDGLLYDLQVGGEPIFTANWLYAHNSMDAPLVMSSRIDPTEIDDEAHNMDVVDTYPLEFYEATRRMDPPESVDITIAEDTLETDPAATTFRHTHETSNLSLGPDLSAYKTLETMMDKMDAQLALARKLCAVDETDVAERVIEYHFLPDLIGNLRAFSRQETRCLDCGAKFRRMPLTGSCRECGGNVNLTVHEGSVSKYMETALSVADEFGCREYTKQRLNILERSLESIFEDDTNKQTGIADFM